ncbi:MAG TPA: lamin tail domain-containing protein [candidate division WOR-3 bacterium]|uniref:Lamin tail domain-containing protein n=1 Tax=candidate division WOR-3 bacterium TaxID=2052148 RepID=A0A7C1B4U5_UNCW3|nr:lamin tail domain-containing protein [candidate division WOR-3 bacterium]
MVKKAVLTLIISISFLGAASVVINEVSFGDLQWVELHNLTGAEVNLNGWIIENAKGADELYGTIPPFGYIVITESKSLFTQAFPDVDRNRVLEIRDGSIGKGLSGKSDMLLLKDSRGNIVDFLNWGQPDPFWPNYISSLWDPGITPIKTVIARIPDGQDTDSPYDFKSVGQPTPGEENPTSSGLDVSSWGKIKAIFSGGRKG